MWKGSKSHRREGWKLGPLPNVSQHSIVRANNRYPPGASTGYIVYSEPPILIVPPRVETRVGLYFCPRMVLLGSRGIELTSRQGILLLRRDICDFNNVSKVSWRLERPLFVQRYSTVSGRCAAVGRLVPCTAVRTLRYLDGPRRLGGGVLDRLL